VAFDPPTAIDACDGSPTIVKVGDDVTTPGNCPQARNVTRTWVARDACGNTSQPCSQTVHVVDTTAPSITCAGPQTIECPATPSFTAPTVLDACDPNPTVTSEDSSAAGTCPQSRVYTRTWTATDHCGNHASCSQSITVVDTTAPVITCPLSVTIIDGDPLPSATATDNCDPNPTVTYRDRTTVDGCGKVIVRTWTAADHCGNSATCDQTITVLPKCLVTNTERCCFDCNSLNGQQFRLVFTPDVSNPGCYKLNASNPGQFYYNVFQSGAAGSPVSLTITVPYPFVTQGAVPVHAYNGVTVYGASGPLDSTCPASTCLTPAGDVTAGFTVTYGPSSVVCGSSSGSGQTITVNGIMPSTGFLFVAVHLDYGLKGCPAYNQDSSGSAVACGTSTVLIPAVQSYNFGVAGTDTCTSVLQSFNVFKKNPGVGGGANRNTVADGVTVKEPVPNCAAVLKDAKGAILASGTTDGDGWYMLSYKYTGKATTLYVTLTPPGGKAQTQTITLKANGYVQVDFTCQ
jgi:hypothetical protein